MAKAPLAPIGKDRWNARTARHLLNRAGFGVPAERVDALAAMSPEEAVSSLVAFEHTRYQAPVLPGMLTPDAYGAAQREARALDDAARRVRTQELRRQERASVTALQAWWLERLTTSPRPLEEKMALFWHGHFATSAQKVQLAWAAWDLNETFRRYATGNAKSLTIAVGQSMSMLRYLDNFRNVKAHPNENWARELLELFTMGVGNYSEQDVKEAARAFTGWTIERGGFAYNESQHDFGTKQFLGRRGVFDGWDIIDIVFEQPETAKFFAGKLWAYFAEKDPAPEIVAALADTLRMSGYNLRPFLYTMFLSEAFYSPRIMGNQVKSPVQFVVQLVHDLQLTSPPYAAMARATAALGQNLFYPPNVKGWDGGRAWINANTLLLRYNLPRTIAVAGMEQERGSNGMEMTMAPEDMPTTQRARIREMLDDLPDEEREQLRTELAGVKPRERRQIVLDALVKHVPAWDGATLFPHGYYASAEDCIAALSRRYLARPLAPESAHVLVESLGQAGPVTLDEVPKPKLDATLHLLFSCAEYQLC